MRISTPVLTTGTESVLLQKTWCVTYLRCSAASVWSTPPFGRNTRAPWEATRTKLLLRIREYKNAVRT